MKYSIAFQEESKLDITRNPLNKTRTQIVSIDRDSYRSFSSLSNAIIS
jgi:hypothetical protein